MKNIMKKSLTALALVAAGSLALPLVTLADSPIGSTMVVSVPAGKTVSSEQFLATKAGAYYNCSLISSQSGVSVFSTSTGVVNNNPNPVAVILKSGWNTALVMQSNTDGGAPNNAFNLAFQGSQKDATVYLTCTYSQNEGK